VDAAAAEPVGSGRRSMDFSLGPLKQVTPACFDSILYRTDPPVDLAYFHLLQLLLVSLAFDTSPNNTDCERPGCPVYGKRKAWALALCRLYCTVCSV
jgi:hypothetical protein